MLFAIIGAAMFAVAVYIAVLIIPWLFIAAFIPFAYASECYDRFWNSPKVTSFLERNSLWIYGPKNPLHYFLTVIGVVIFALVVIPAIILAFIL